MKPGSTTILPSPKNSGNSGQKKERKSKSNLYAGKALTTVFWDSKGIVFMNSLQKGASITGEYYASLLDQLQEKIRTNRPHLAKKKILFHQDNAPPHKARAFMETLRELRYEILPHPAYSPDLVPQGFPSLPRIEKMAGRKKIF